MAGYRLLYHDIVLERDLPGIPRNMRDRILRAVEKRLAVEPAKYGQRLRRSLLGLWKLRVGDYRIIYSIDGKTVRIQAVGHRRDAYAEATRRWEREDDET